MNTSRRSFLKVAGLSAFALSSGMAGLAGTAGAARAQIAPGRYERGENALTAKRWAMVIDTRQFRGPEDYEALIEACHKVHNVPHIPGNQNIKWFWLDKYDRVFPDDMNAHINDKTRQADYPLLCNHCTNPPCVRVCPTQATYRMEDGIVAMDYHRCIAAASAWPAVLTARALSTLWTRVNTFRIPCPTRPSPPA